MSSGNEARFIPANVFPAPRNFIMQRELCPAMLKTDMKQKIRNSVTRKKDNTKITIIYLPYDCPILVKKTITRKMAPMIGLKISILIIETYIIKKELDFFI